MAQFFCLFVCVCALCFYFISDNQKSFCICFLHDIVLGSNQILSHHIENSRFVHTIPVSCKHSKHSQIVSNFFLLTTSFNSFTCYKPAPLHQVVTWWFVIQFNKFSIANKSLLLMSCLKRRHCASPLFYWFCVGNLLSMENKFRSRKNIPRQENLSSFFFFCCWGGWGWQGEFLQALSVQVSLVGQQ